MTTAQRMDDLYSEIAKICNGRDFAETMTVLIELVAAGFYENAFGEDRYERLDEAAEMTAKQLRTIWAGYSATDENCCGENKIN